MDMNLRHLAAGELTDSLPETPHELPFDRAKIDELIDRVRKGEPVDLLTEMLACVDWRGTFTEPDGRPITIEDIARLIAYYKQKFADVGVIYIADLLSTEFMTEQRAQGDIVFSEELLRLFRGPARRLARNPPLLPPQGVRDRAPHPGSRQPLGFPEPGRQGAGNRDRATGARMEQPIRADRLLICST